MLRPTLVIALAIPAWSLVACASHEPSANAAPDRVDLRWKDDEARAALELMRHAARSVTITIDDWERVRRSEGYQRLVQREKQMGRELRDDEMQAFLTSPDTVKREPALRDALAEWRKADLQAAAARVLAYLPDDARIHASVYPVIKPQSNSFVFETSTNPAIFLYLDPTIPSAKFENTVAHELHHIGFASLPKDAVRHPEKVQTVLDWMGAFGEGFAMLAAAGGPDVHPHACSPAADRERWDRDVANFDADLKKVEQFFLDVLDGKLATQDDIQKVAFSFFGVQGPWYTVGWKMAVVVEKRYGRATLIEGMRRPERLLATYNVAAKESAARGGERSASWSEDLLARVGAVPLID